MRAILAPGVVPWVGPSPIAAPLGRLFLTSWIGRPGLCWGTVREGQHFHTIQYWRAATPPEVELALVSKLNALGDTLKEREVESTWLHNELTEQGSQLSHSRRDCVDLAGDVEQLRGKLAISNAYSPPGLPDQVERALGGVAVEVRELKHQIERALADAESKATDAAIQALGPKPIPASTWGKPERWITSWLRPDEPKPPTVAEEVAAQQTELFGVCATSGERDCAEVIGAGSCGPRCVCMGCLAERRIADRGICRKVPPEGWITFGPGALGWRWREPVQVAAVGEAPADIVWRSTGVHFVGIDQAVTPNLAGVVEGPAFVAQRGTVAPSVGDLRVPLHDDGFGHLRGFGGVIQRAAAAARPSEALATASCSCGWSGVASALVARSLTVLPELQGWAPELKCCPSCDVVVVVGGAAQ